MAKCKPIVGVITMTAFYKSEQAKGWYLIMKRVERYLDLFDYISRAKYLSEDKAAFFFKQLIEILKNCHQQKVLHRDIKDENILVDETTDLIYLIDFGSGAFLKTDDYKDFDGEEFVLLTYTHTRARAHTRTNTHRHAKRRVRVVFLSTKAVRKSEFNFHVAAPIRLINSIIPSAEIITWTK